ncbi:hypothetical protein NKG94_38600 [Micromonospora sp. M12]
MPAGQIVYVGDSWEHDVVAPSGPACGRCG